MPTMKQLARIARSVSVYTKIVAALIGFLAAYLWYKSAIALEPQMASSLNAWAAGVTAGSACLQGISSLIDWLIAPTATYA